MIILYFIYLFFLLGFDQEAWVGNVGCGEFQHHHTVTRGSVQELQGVYVRVYVCACVYVSHVHIIDIIVSIGSVVVMSWVLVVL